jgi:hypothetical protein
MGTWELFLHDLQQINSFHSSIKLDSHSLLKIFGISKTDHLHLFLLSESFFLSLYILFIEMNSTIHFTNKLCEITVLKERHHQQTFFVNTKSLLNFQLTIYI